MFGDSAAFFDTARSSIDNRMSTTLDPSTEAFPRTSAALANGKLDAPPSQAAARPKFWRKDAPKAVRGAKLAVDEAWNTYFKKRHARPSIAELCHASQSPLHWAIEAEQVSNEIRRLLELADERLKPKARKKYLKEDNRQELRVALVRWLEGARHAKPSREHAVGCLAAAYLVSDAGAAVDAVFGWKLIDFLADTARHAQAWHPKSEGSSEAAVAQQMLAGELALTLAYLYSEMAPLWDLHREAGARLAEGFHEMLNGRGLPRAAQLASLRALLACWTRCRAIGSTSKKLRWPKVVERQFKYAVRQVIRWTAADGSCLLAEVGGVRLSDELVTTALRLSDCPQNAVAACELLGKQIAPKRLRKNGKKPSRASDNCEWACLAMMRSGWSPDAAAVAVDFSMPRMRLDVWASTRRLLSGAWAIEPRLDDRPLVPVGQWEQLCWFNDKDADYLEFSLPLEGGTRLERQILLAHRDKFLLLVDHLKSVEPAHLEHAWQLPLAPALLFCGDGETRDALLVDGVPHSRLIPLALPEWRIDPRVGELSHSGNAVRLSEQTVGRNLACPLFVDLCPNRSALPCTWRQLTVAESLAIKPADVAVSYRIQSGPDQWVYYRSQGPRGNRTFLGQNTSSECLIARFKAPDGEVRSLLEIEG
jgi:hypothetical protein